MRIVPPGDDLQAVPPPVTQVPPQDQFCDLVMTGGVASGVVYPWAIVEIARKFWFRNIGGTSVGAMAAALAAAAEYGRRTGNDQSFEPLRRTPASLGELLPDGRTRMLSLFQPIQRGQRIMKLWGRLGQGRPVVKSQSAPNAGSPAARQPQWAPSLAQSLTRGVLEVTRAYWRPLLLGGLVAVGLLLVASIGWPLSVQGLDGLPLVLVGLFQIVLLLLAVLVGAMAGLVCAVLTDLRYGLIKNNLGLCKGGTLEAKGPEGERPGICEWLHQGIQASAGLKATDRPLTFRDLWCAPDSPGAPHLQCLETDPPTRRSINLQMITTNVTHGRPYRLPMSDETSRLFYKRDELTDYFPPVVCDALFVVSRPYAPKNKSDPQSISCAADFRELPGADLPIVVAARLSLSFPILFSAVPLWAIDYEAAPGTRDLRRCLFTDGGASSNFPIHLFDAALPRWPTFGLWLDRLDPRRPPIPTTVDPDVWLPEFQGQGWGDNWNRFDTEAAAPSPDAGAIARDGALKQLKFLVGFLSGTAKSAVDWHDRTSFRLPHVRNRVARLWLKRGEGGLHIGMPRDLILEMANRYGTKAGKLFVARFAGPDGEAATAWSEQRWVRLAVLVSGMRELLAGLKASADWSALTMPMNQAISKAVKFAPIIQRVPVELTPEQSKSLLLLLAELERLEGHLQSAVAQPFKPVPASELRLHARL